MTCNKHPYNAWQSGPCITCANLAVFQPLWQAEDEQVSRAAWTSAQQMGRMVQSPASIMRRAMIASEASRIARAARSLG